MDLYYLLLYFFVYGFLGWCTEVAYAAFKEHRFVNRGFLNGPICPIYGVGVSAVIAVLTPYKSNLVPLYISSVLLVTLLEGVTGWAMDKIFHNKWWDYSDMPFNIGGYVCLVFSLVWGVACVAIMDFIHPLIHSALTYLPYIAGIVLIAVIGIILTADLYVTASTIFQFNRRLAGMEKIAAEMHEISDQIGQDIYERTIQAIELEETSKQKLDKTASEWKERSQEAASGLREKSQAAASGLREKTQAAAGRSQEVSEELRQRIADLQLRYQESFLKPGRVSRRLMRAFPKMESRNHREQLEQLRKKW